MVYTGDISHTATLQQDKIIVREALTIFDGRFKQMKPIGLAELVKLLKVDAQCFMGVMSRHEELKSLVVIMQDPHRIRANASTLRTRIERLIQKHNA